MCETMCTIYVQKCAFKCGQFEIRNICALSLVCNTWTNTTHTQILFKCIEKYFASFGKIQDLNYLFLNGCYFTLKFPSYGYMYVYTMLFLNKQVIQANIFSFLVRPSVRPYNTIVPLSTCLNRFSCS